jgi:hypothetical protein
MAMPPVGARLPTVMVSGPSVPLKKVTDIGADYFGWADNGKTVAWAVGASYFRQPFNSISFEPPKEEKKDARKKTATLRTRTKTEKRKTPRTLRTTPRKTRRRKRKNRRNSRSRKKTCRKSPSTSNFRAKLPRVQSCCAGRAWSL